MMDQDHATQSGNANASVSDTLSSILSNPDMMEKIKSIATQMSSASPSSNVNAPAPQSPTIPTDGLGTILSNPELMAKLPQLMSMVGPMLSSSNSPGEKNTVSKEKSAEDCRNQLLLALKPFLSSERCQAIDTMLRISKLGNILRQIK